MQLELHRPSHHPTPQKAHPSPSSIPSVPTSRYQTKGLQKSTQPSPHRPRPSPQPQPPTPNPIPSHPSSHKPAIRLRSRRHKAERISLTNRRLATRPAWVSDPVYYAMLYYTQLTVIAIPPIDTVDSVGKQEKWYGIRLWGIEFGREMVESRSSMNHAFGLMRVCM